MEKLKHYKWYSDTDFPEYDVCLEHPTAKNFTLCGCAIDQTPDGNPEETDEKINCKFCLKVIKIIAEFYLFKELQNV